MALVDRYRLKQGASDIEKTIKHFEEALRLQRSENPGYLTSLNALGVAFFDRYRRTSKPPDLQDAIKYYQKALKLYPIEHPERATSLST